MRGTIAKSNYSANQKDIKVAMTTLSTTINHHQNPSPRETQAQISQFTRENQKEHSKSFRYDQPQRTALQEVGNRIQHKRFSTFATTRNLQEIDHQFAKININHNTAYTIGTPYGFDVSKDRIIFGDRSLHNLLSCDKQQFSKMMQSVSQTGHFHPEKGIRVTCKMYGIRTSAFS